ncbi:MAG: hypothetical protein Q8L48_31905 [Archangium sp.]|nr:hypothetical protein [Archangium sp.]
MNKALVVATLVIASTGFAEGWSPRASAFQAKAAAERKRLGLDPEKARKQYPTPEVRFGGWACPGETTTVLLEGRLQPGTLVGTASTAVEIVKEELTPKGWQGTLKVKAGTKDPIRLELIAPVSGISNDIELPVGCPHEWIIEVKGGDKLVLKVVDGESHASGEWFRGATAVEARNFDLASDGKTFSLNQKESAEDRERRKKAEEGFKGSEGKATAERQHQLSQQMQGCTAMPPAQMAPCIQKLSAELQELMAKQQQAVQTAQAAAAPKVGCTQFSGTIDGKKLKGNGMSCAVAKQGFEQVPFTGVIK